VLRHRAANGAALSSTGSTAPAFVALALPVPTLSAGDIRIEVERGATCVNITWPAAAAEG
jgi:hypothetical protein